MEMQAIHSLDDTKVENAKQPIQGKITTASNKDNIAAMIAYNGQTCEKLKSSFTSTLKNEMNLKIYREHVCQC